MKILKNWGNYFLFCAYCYTLCFRLRIIWIYSFQLIVVDVVSSYLSRDKPFKQVQPVLILEPRISKSWDLTVSIFNFFKRTIVKTGGLSPRRRQLNISYILSILTRFIPLTWMGLVSWQGSGSIEQMKYFESKFKNQIQIPAESHCWLELPNQWHSNAKPLQKRDYLRYSLSNSRT